MSKDSGESVEWWPERGDIQVDNLMTRAVYEQFRLRNLSRIIQERQRRSLDLGEHLRLQFESELTLRYQIQEMLRIERIDEVHGIQSEIDAYAPLMPKGQDWSATLFLQYPEPEKRREALQQLVGVEKRVFLEIVDQDGMVFQVHACAHDEPVQLEPQEASVRALKTSAVHFIRFEFAPEVVERLKNGARVCLRCEHEHYQHRCDLPQEMLKILAADLI